MTAGDTLRFSAQAVDSSGSPVANALIRFVGSGGRFEGRVTARLVSAGSTGVWARRSRASRVLARSWSGWRSDAAGPAASVTITPQITRWSPASDLPTGAAFSARGDKRTDKIKGGVPPSVADVATDGLLTASAPVRQRSRPRSTEPVFVSGRGTGRHHRVARDLACENRCEAGDVIRFTVTAHDRAGKKIEGLTPRWSFSPGEGSSAMTEPSFATRRARIS